MNVGQIFRSTFNQPYSEPQWKQLASSIRQARRNACDICRRSDVVTQVHHWYYVRGRKPWEYESHELALLCKGCHEELHQQLSNFRQFVFPKLTPRAFQVLNGALSVALREVGDPLKVVYAIAELIGTKGAIDRLANAWAEGEAKPAPALTQDASSARGGV